MLMEKGSDKMLSLRELHLTPHFIYLVQSTQNDQRQDYALEIWKDSTKIGVTTDITKIRANKTDKHTTLQFKSIRFVFDVQALFEQKSAALIKLKLTSADGYGQQKQLLDEFHLHLLYYNYQFSKDKFVRYKENSIGQINHNIFNYSFSALYGDPVESLLFRKHQTGIQSGELEDLGLTKKNSKYGLLIRDEKSSDIDTIFIIQSVAQTEVSLFATKSTSLKDYNESYTKSKVSPLIECPEDEDVIQNFRNVPRSILDDVAFQKGDSTLTENEALEQISLKSHSITALLFICFGFYLIYYLMHPVKKI